MNILIPSSSFFPAQEGGPSNTLYWLASGLAANGHVVKVVTTNRYITDPTIVFDKWIKLNGFDVIYTTNKELKKQLLDQSLGDCDLVIANGLCVLSNFIFNLKALSQDKKVIISPRGELLASAVFHKGRLYGWIKELLFCIMRVAYGKRVLYQATSEDESRSIKKYMGEKARVCIIPNYMILPKKRERDKENSYLLYVGRINQIKNLDILIESVGASDSFRQSNYKLLIAGEKKGEYYLSLKRRLEELGLSERVVFLGLIVGEERDYLYANAKCLLLLSKSENFGNVVIEALAQGTPVIVSTGTPWESVAYKEAGYWVEATVDEVTKAIEEFLSMSNDDYNKMRKNALALSKEYDIYSNMYKWESLLNSL